MQKLLRTSFFALFAFVLAAGMAAAPAQAQDDIYVDDSDGSDNQPGTPTQPLRSIQAAVSQADEDGDRIIVRGGDFTINSGSPTVSNGITIEFVDAADGATTVEFDEGFTFDPGSGATVDIVANGATLNLTDSSDPIELASGDVNIDASSTVTLPDGVTITRADGQVTGAAPTFGENLNLNYEPSGEVSAGLVLPSDGNLGSGDLNVRSGTVTFDQSVTATQFGLSDGASADFGANDLTVDAASGDGAGTEGGDITVAANSALTVNGTLMTSTDDAALAVDGEYTGGDVTLGSIASASDVVSGSGTVGIGTLTVTLADSLAGNGTANAFNTEVNAGGDFTISEVAVDLTEDSDSGDQILVNLNAPTSNSALEVTSGDEIGSIVVDDADATIDVGAITSTGVVSNDGTLNVNDAATLASGSNIRTVGGTTNINASGVTFDASGAAIDNDNASGAVVNVTEDATFIGAVRNGSNNPELNVPSGVTLTIQTGGGDVLHTMTSSNGYTGAGEVVFAGEEGSHTVRTNGDTFEGKITVDGPDTEGEDLTFQGSLTVGTIETNTTTVLETRNGNGTVTTTQDFLVNGFTRFAGNQVTVGGNLNTTAQLDVESPLDVTGNFTTTQNGGNANLLVASATTVGGNFEVGDTTQVDAEVTVTGDFVADDQTDVNATLDVASNVDANAALNIPDGGTLVAEGDVDFREGGVMPADEAEGEPDVTGGEIQFIGGAGSDATFYPNQTFNFAGSLLFDKTAANDDPQVTLANSAARVGGDITVNHLDESAQDDNAINLNGFDLFLDGTFTLDGSSTEREVNPGVGEDGEGGRIVFTSDGMLAGSGGYSNIAVATGETADNVTVNEEITFYGTLELFQGGINVTGQNGNVQPGAQANLPSGTEAPAVRRVVDGINAGTGTQITGAFNAADNPYDLIYGQSGGSSYQNPVDTQGELSMNVRALTVEDSAGVDLTRDFTATNTVTVRGHFTSQNDNVLTLGSAGPHTVTGALTAGVEVDASETTIQGYTEGNVADEDDAILGNVTVLDGGSITVDNVKKIDGDLVMNSGASASSVALATDSDFSNNTLLSAPAQAITGRTELLDGNTLAYESNVESYSPVQVDNGGTLNLNDNRLALVDANFAGNSGDNSYEGSGVVEMRETDGNADFLSLSGATLPNLEVTDETGEETTAAALGLTGNVDVAGNLLVENTIDSQGNNLTFSNSGDDTATLAVAPAFLGTGTLEAQGTTILAQADTEISNFAVNTNGTVELNGGEGGGFTVSILSSLSLDSGTFNHGANTVQVEGTDLNVASGISVVSEADSAYLALYRERGDNSSPLNVNTSGGGESTIDRLQVRGDAAFTTGTDAETITVDEFLWLNDQLDAASGDEGDQLAIADQATIRRTEGYPASNALTEAPMFNGEVNLIYNRIEDGTVDFTSGPEIPASGSDGTIADLTIDVGPSNVIAGEAEDGWVRFPELDTGVSANPVTVNGTVDLVSGYLEHGTDGSNDLRRLTLADGAVFAQKNGKIEEHDGTRDNIVASDYTLRYYPTTENGTLSGLTTGDQEFLAGGAVSTLEFIDGPVDSPSGAGINLHAAREVGSVVVNRTATSSGAPTSELNVGSELTVNGTSEILAGEVTGGTLDSDGTSGNLANGSDVLVEGVLSADLEAEGKTLVQGNGEIGLNTLDLAGDLEIDQGELERSDLATEANVLASNGTFDPSYLTFDGTGTQDVEVQENIIVEEIVVNQTTPSNGTTPKVEITGGNVITGAQEGPPGELNESHESPLELRGGLLVANLVDIGFGGYVREVEDGEESHVVGAVRRGIAPETDYPPIIAPSGGQTVVFPVGSENPSYRRYRFYFPAGQLASTNEVTVRHVDNESFEVTNGLPITDNTGVTVGTSLPDFYWQVTAASDLPLSAEYEVSARVDDGDLTFSDSRPASDHRLLRRNRSDSPENTTWKLVGDGDGYQNEGPVEGVADIRSQSATADVTNLGRIFTVGVPAGPGPMIVTNNGLSLTEGESAALTDSLVAEDDNNVADSLDYTVTDGPSQGELEVNGSPASTFTQADLNSGNVVYNHTASNADNDSFAFEVSDPAGNTVQDTFNVTVEQGLVAISGTVSYPNEGEESLTQGSPLSGVTVQVNALSGGTSETVTTDSEGNFSVQVPAAEYTVQAQVTRDVPSEINATDANRTINAYLGTEPFTGTFQSEVADVNDNGTENATDALRMALFFNNPGGVSFAAGNWHSSTDTVDVSGGTAANATVYAAAYGDADLSGPGTTGGTTVATVSSEQAGAAQVTADANLRSVEIGKTFEVPVRLSGGATLGSYSLAVDFPADKASFEGVVSGDDRNVMTNTTDGTVRISWFDRAGNQPMQLEENGKLVTLRFSASSDVEEGVTFSPTVTGGELADASAEVLSGAQVEIESIQIGSTAPDKFALKGNYPNPVASGQTRVQMDLPSDASVTIEVYNTLGQRVMQAEQSMSAGTDQVVQIDASTLSSGQYFYRVSAEMGGDVAKDTGRMTVVK